MEFFSILLGGVIILTVGATVWALWTSRNTPPDIKASDVGLVASYTQDPSLAVAAYTAGKALSADDSDKDDLDVSTTTVLENLSSEPDIEVDEDSDSDFMVSLQETKEIQARVKLSNETADTGTHIISLSGHDGWMTEETLTKEDFVKCWGCENCGPDSTKEKEKNND